MPIANEKNNAVLERFHELLRSGKDYSVKYMYEESGKIAYIKWRSVRRIINDYYHTIITPEMFDFIKSTNLCGDDQIKGFSDKFELCRRESILIIRYIKWKKNFEIF